MPEGQIFIIPVRLDNCKVPDQFSHLHYVDLFEGGSFEKVLGAIKAKDDSNIQGYTLE